MPKMISKRILLLDSPQNHLQELEEAFRMACGKHAVLCTVKTKEHLLQELEHSTAYNIVVIDYFIGDGQTTGVELVKEIRQLDDDILILMVAERGDVDTARRAIEAGATDFLVRNQRLPERLETQLRKIRLLLKLSEKNRSLDQQNKLLYAQEQARHQLIGDSPQMLEILSSIERVAHIPRPVLIFGERGTGKELIARAIHKSGVANKPFVVVNCAAFTDTLLENELFGHEQGAFTGAHTTGHGKFEQADGGTLFLDEIGNMSLAFQQKILRVVEYGSFSRVGGEKEVQVKVRIIAATNADLSKKMQEGHFLPDLYDRLAFEVIHVPPLRQREGDIEALSQYFVRQFVREVPAFRGRRLSLESLEELKNYHFPGNARELKNIIERAVCRDTAKEITPQDLGIRREFPKPKAQGTFYEQIDALAEHLIMDALQKSNHNQAKAARMLGLSYHQFRYYYRKFTGKAQSSSENTAIQPSV